MVLHRVISEAFQSYHLRAPSHVANACLSLLLHSQQDSGLKTFHLNVFSPEFGSYFFLSFDWSISTLRLSCVS